MIRLLPLLLLVGCATTKPTPYLKTTNAALADCIAYQPKRDANGEYELHTCDMDNPEHWHSAKGGRP